jgi:putative transposase
MWNLPPPPGFQGLRDDLPIRFYEQLLPHWRQHGATYFVTFRLHDSLPESKLDELRGIKAEWDRKHPPPRSRPVQDEMGRDLSRRMEEWLDQGMGSCVLRQPDLADRVVAAMRDGEGIRHELACYVVMPNHVHAIVRPLVPSDNDLEGILQIWKGRSAYEINQRLGRTGIFWQRESYDRIIRDEEHLWHVIQYIGRNPAKACLPRGAAPLWINPEWVALGWNFECEPR